MTETCSRLFSLVLTLVRFLFSKIAMKLFKKTGQHKYVFWAVTSIYLQHLSTSSDGGDASKKPKPMLQLAETMCKRSVGVVGLGSLASTCGPDAVLIYLEVLFAQGKRKEALELIRSAQGQ